MDKIVIPPSPNWHLSSVLACNENGLMAYGSKCEISIINLKSDGKYDVKFINMAHKEKVNVVVFSPINGSFKNCLATCGDDGFVRVWDFQETRLLFCHSGHKGGVKVMGLDWSTADSNRLVSVNDLGTIVCWDLVSNTIRRLTCGVVRVLPLCLSCCPHDKDLIAIGCKGGITLVVNIKGSGKIIHRLRSHEEDVISISWCPVAFNVIKYKKNANPTSGSDNQEVASSEELPRELLLATGGLDRAIYLWRTGSDGRYEVSLAQSNSSFARKKGQMGNAMLWTCVRWVDAYTLLFTGQFGELLSWDLNKVYSGNDKSGNKRPQSKLLHSRHHKGCFSIACPVIYDVVPDWSSDKRIVWSTAMDKRVVACSLTSGNITVDITTLGGNVLSMDISPLDPNRLAIGSSDSKVFIWNMSDIHSLNITTLWKKIIGKVMALCWHPLEENWLAYGTSDGHVGLIDVGCNQGTTTLFRLHHRKAVYRLCWAPPILKGDDTAADDNKLALYSVGDGDVFQYRANPPEVNEEPKSLNTALLNSIDKGLGLKKPLIRSEIIFKPDQTCFAVGSENGSVYIVNRETLALKHVVYPHKKLINNLEWHPETVASDNSISPYKDWLATTCDIVRVYNIPSEGQTDLVATFCGHMEKIVGLAWSPHFNGRLLSASYDYTVQVWDVPNQSCIGVCQIHLMPVMCALFSPQDPDIIISGSNDNTVRLWSISEMTSASTVKPGKKKERIDNAYKHRSEAAEATELTVGVSAISENVEFADSREKHNGSRASSRANSPNSSLSSSFTVKGIEDYKKRQKSRAVFTVTGPKLATARHFETLYQRWTAASSGATPPAVPDYDGAPSASDLGYLDFFGDNKAMRRLLMVEEDQLTETRQHQMAQHSALWRGDVSQMIQEAIVKKQLNDWLVSIAPLAGFGTWEQACESYAAQLVECGEVSKASSYLLATHKVHEAVRLLLDYKLYREAIAVAKCRLPADDPLITEVYAEWGHTARQQGTLPLAAHCFLAANDMQSCIEMLARVKELKILRIAASLARQFGQTELADSLAVECLTLSVVASNHAVGYLLIAEMPQYQHWSVWLRASELLAKVKNRNEREVFDWLEGRQQGLLSLFEELTTACSSVPQVYQKLLPHLPTNKTPEFERDMWFYVSGQLAAACAARQEATPDHFLRHIVLALSAAFHFQTNHPHSLALPFTVSLITPSGLFAKDSILTADYDTAECKQLMKSIKAFVCASFIHWMNNNWGKVTALISKSEVIPGENGSGDSNKQCDGLKMSWLPEMLSSYSAIVLDPENVTFFVKKAQKQELLDVVAKENIQKKCMDKKVKSKNGKTSNNKTIQTEGKSKTVIEKTTIKDSYCEEGQVTNEGSGVQKVQKDENLNITVAKSGISELGDKSENSQETSAIIKKDITDLQEVNVLDKNCKDNSIEPLKKVEDKPDLVKNSNENGDSHKVVSANTSDPKSPDDKTESIDSLKPEPVTTTSTLPDTLTTPTVNGSTAVRNGSESPEELGESLNLREIKELDTVLQKIEKERVSVPCPFTAYMNIKYLIDNLVNKQDSKLAQTLQEDCNQIWKNSNK